MQEHKPPACEIKSQAGGLCSYHLNSYTPYHLSLIPYTYIKTRKIIHIDMDAFFASVEQRDFPQLRGVPVAVGGDGPRGVVATASYEARRFGVHSAMAMTKAKRLCPELHIVPCRFSVYKAVSGQIHDIFHEYTDIVEPLSLDEAFLDVTHNKPGIELAQQVAREIKQKIRECTGLTASAGISYCKFLAKIASDYHKPDGMFTVHPVRALDFIAGLPIEDFWGVGPKTAQKMHRLGIFTGAHLRALPLGFLMKEFGKAGRIYHDFSRGIDTRPVETERVRKSVGCEETFLTDIYADDDIRRELTALAAELDRRLHRNSFEGASLTLKVKYFDFTQITRSATADHLLVEADDILAIALRLMSHVDPERPVRLLGLTVNKTYPHPSTTGRAPIHPTLFDEMLTDLL